MTKEGSRAVRLCLVLGIILVLVCGRAISALAAAPWFALRTYSDLEYIEKEGETVGTAITIIPSNRGIQILWQVGEGPLFPARLYDAVRDGEFLVVVVPPGDLETAGTWRLLERDDVLTVKGNLRTEFGALRPGAEIASYAVY